MCIDNGVYLFFFMYNYFLKFICISVNNVVCYGIFDFRFLEEGDIINVDIIVSLVVVLYFFLV